MCSPCRKPHPCVPHIFQVLSKKHSARPRERKTNSEKPHRAGRLPGAFRPGRGRWGRPPAGPGHQALLASHSMQEPCKNRRFSREESGQPCPGSFWNPKAGMTEAQLHVLHRVYPWLCPPPASVHRVSGHNQETSQPCWDSILRSPSGGLALGRRGLHLTGAVAPQ